MRLHRAIQRFHCRVVQNEKKSKWYLDLDMILYTIQYSYMYVVIDSNGKKTKSKVLLLYVER